MVMVLLVVVLVLVRLLTVDCGVWARITGE